MSDPVLIDELGALVDAVRDLASRADAQELRMRRMMEAIRLAHDDDRTLRRELQAARLTPSYAEAFDSPKPLVSIIVPTWTNAEGLRSVSLPSALAQTYENIEIVVVGDAAPPEVADVVGEFDDPRIRFHNLPTRGPYPDDPRGAWLTSGTPSYNAAAALAQGAWIAPLADDDVFRPHHVEKLLALARQKRLEFVYGKFTFNMPGSEQTVRGVFPPVAGEIGLQMALYHSAVRIFELELGDAVFDEANDLAVMRRMLRAGVRFGMVDEIVTDYYPSMREVPPEADSSGPEETPLGRALAERVVELEQQCAALGEEAASLRQRELEMREQLSDLERELSVVYGSKSWRLTRLMRDAVARLRSA